MFEVNYNKKKAFNINITVALFIAAIFGSILVPVILFGSFFTAKAEASDNTPTISNRDILLSSVANMSQTNATTANSGALPFGAACGFYDPNNVHSGPLCSPAVFNGCQPGAGQMCFCSGGTFLGHDNASGYSYFSKFSFGGLNCGASCSGKSGYYPNGDGTSCGNPYTCPTTPTPTPTATPSPTPAPAARCDYLDGPSGTFTSPQHVCYTAHGTFSNGAKADHVDVTFRSSNGETLSNRTTGLNGATNGVVSNQECFDISNQGSYQFTATYYSQGGVSVSNNAGGSCSKAITITAPTQTPVPTTTPPGHGGGGTPTPTPTPTPTATPTRAPQTLTMQVTAKCTDNSNFNLNDGNTVSFRLYDNGQATQRLDKRTPYTLTDLQPNVPFVLVPNRLFIPLSNGATATLRHNANVNGVSQNLGTISPINYNNGFHLQVSPTQNSTVEFLYDNCNVVTTPTPTQTPTVTPTQTPVPAARCISIEKTVQNGNDICYKVTGQFDNANASRIRVTYDTNDATISEDRNFNPTKTGKIIEENFCHTYDTSGNFNVKAEFKAADNTPVNITGNGTGACLTSVNVPTTPTPTTVPPTKTPQVLAATTTPPPALVNTGQWNTFINIALGFAIFAIILAIRNRKNRSPQNEFENTYMNYYLNSTPVASQLNPSNNDIYRDPYDLYSYENPFTRSNSEDVMNSNNVESIPEATTSLENNTSSTEIDTKEPSKPKRSDGRLI